MDGMDVRRIAGWTARYLARAIVVALALLAVAPLASASAAFPELRIEAPANDSISGNPTPSFSGSTEDLEDEVVLSVYQGTAATGSPVQTLGTLSPPAAGSWAVGPVESLPDGIYTAQATQTNASSETATSNSVTFEVLTAAPTVNLDPHQSPTGDNTPSFSGTASDHTQVVVHLYNASSEQVATATASGTGAGWSSGGASPALPDGSYTAVATQASSLGNPEGESNHVSFTVDTAPPTVTLKQPPSPSKDSTPTFAGGASDSGEVVVHIRNASNQEEHATASPSGGGFSTSNESALPSGTYTAYATQKSSLGNPEGVSNTVTFTINTASPTVTLNQPPSLSNDTTPSFTGFASDTEPVTITIYSGSTPVASATAEGNGGDWSSGAASPALADGHYTAIATQESSIGNPKGTSNAVTFTVSTAAPSVTLNTPKTPSNNTTPSFTGSGSDVEPITVAIYAGSKAEGLPVSFAGASGTGGGWSSGQASPALSSGQYTAVAHQPSSLGNPEGTSNAVTFLIDTSSPTVTLEAPPALSNDSTPTFSGTATDTTKVVVHILNGAKSEVATATANPSGGLWSTSNESSLPSGSYTAVATQASSLGNPSGVSGMVSFTVNTASPTVTLASPGRTNDTTPAFNGTGSDTTQVTIQIYKGSKAEGTPVSTATAAGTGGAWTSGPASPPLANGQYVAVASQPSSLGNPAGHSAVEKFEVDTSSPTVTISQPASPSNKTTPTFSGTASDTETVTVDIYKGSKAEGTSIASATAAGTGGAWTSGPASPALPSGTYTANAIQKSSLGNAPGVSGSVTFVVETASPHVTLGAIPALSNNTTPSFSGTASDTTTITVQIYAGAKAEGTPLATAAATPVAGAWSSAPASPALPSGAYTALAVQPSSVGNPEGTSNAIQFTVNTAPPTVTLTPPKSPSNNTTPSFAGTASDTTAVEVRVFNAAKLEIAKATATPNGSHQFQTASIAHLADGTYTADATETSSLNNPAGTSATVTFIVDTAPPTVTLAEPPTPSNNLLPTFTGTASDTKPVVVSIYSGLKAVGTPIATATAPAPLLGLWTSPPATKPLPKVRAKYTARATQESSIENPTGQSGEVHFEVNPNAPTVTLNAPPARLNNPTPPFAGSSNEARTPVTVEVFAGGDTKGQRVARAEATVSGGAWASPPVSPLVGPSLPDGQYTVFARQVNGLIEGEVGTSQHFTFTIDTVAPHVTLTSPANGSSSQGESVLVGGLAGTEEHDLQSVTVQLFAGSAIAPGQAPAQSIVVSAAGGAWSGTFAGLGAGAYTVRAEQSDDAGNLGVSGTSTFVLSAPAAPAAPAAAGGPALPAASFVWFPARPRVGEHVSLASSSTDAASPITAFAWDPAGDGPFASGGQLLGLSFSKPGNHTVRLRVTDAAGHSGIATETIPVASRRLSLLKPFPSVKIVTSHASGGVVLSLLIVQAPSKARITVTCIGRSCPIRSQSRVARSSRSGAVWVLFGRFERFLPSGVTLQIRVSKPGQIGKYTRLTVRGGASERYDSCLGPAGLKPIGCPKA
jgi:hypothetical protein